jgi:uncharacterized membrane protein YagU involved in acid resistance
MLERIFVKSHVVILKRKALSHALIELAHEEHISEVVAWFTK